MELCTVLGTVTDPEQWPASYKGGNARCRQCNQRTRTAWTTPSWNV